ncbi:Protein TolB [Streptomyces sp. RB5]|uniref:Protein TolB n=1 Tax=Streptomyces smaragdinus TaxID=2585196 RepID=A0A7K0CTS5_9ACTN|nr:WD40 repeat domain-containing protein [Streptomyces smaragdinus]MQY16877.1 Protein TolB [Streptomyces smaragdinus]
MRGRLQLLFQVLLVLVASMLGIVTNYATNVDDTPWLLRFLQQASIPAIGLLIIAMVVVQVAAYRLDNPAPPPRHNWPQNRAPYPGLGAFDEDESAIFFGREGQCSEVIRRLHETAPQPSDRFVALVGSSGSGKSSMVRAGVMPRLRDRRWSVLPAFTPGANPLGALAAAIAAAGGEPTDTVLRRLRREPAALLSELARLRGTSRFRRMLVVIDQFEELVTLAGERERDRFLEALNTALRRDQRLRILVTLRVDFLSAVLDTGFSELFQRPVAVGALGRRQLAEVVQRPGALVGMSFETGVVEAMLDEASTPDALPLLAYLLQELYLASGPGETVTQDLYRQLGGVAGALARQADHTVAHLHDTDGIGVVLRVLLRFVTVQGTDATRRRVPLDELTPDERRVVDAFIEARLLTSNAESAATGALAYGEVAHEALFRQWPPLRQEVEAQAEQLRRRAELERWAADWQRADRSADYLLTGERLELAQRWLAALEESGQASEPVRVLVESSQRRDLSFLGRVSDSIGQYVLGQVEQQPELSLLLALAALEECAVTDTARRALLAALTTSHLRMQLDGHTDTVRHIAWSPDGRSLATASRDGTARLYDAASGRTRLTLDSAGTMIEGVAWSPDSTRVATASRDQVIRIWDTTTGETLNLLTGATDSGRQVAWSPDGRLIAATFKDQVVRVWDAATGQLTQEMHGHRGDVWGVAWAPDGTRLATTSHDQTAIIWDVATGVPACTLSGHTDFVEGVAWSPDGRSIATGSGDHTVRISDASTGELRLLIRSHTDYVWNLAWSPDGRSIASASSDRTVRITDTTDARTIAVLRGHTDTVWGVTWSPDGRQIASSSTDGTGRVWNLRPHGAEDLVLDGHQRAVNKAAWSRDERSIATASDDGTIRTWSAETGEETGPAIDMGDRVWSVSWSPTDDRLAMSANNGLTKVTPGESAEEINNQGPVVEAIAWSPDGSRIATADHDALLHILTADTGTVVSSMAGHQDWVGAVAWSPSGRYLATTSDDRTGRLWDIAEGQQLTVLRGHDNYVDDITWSPDEARVATASGDWTAALWDAATGRRTAVLKGHEGRVRAVAWSPDGRTIATGSDDKTVRLWSADTHQELTVVGVHQDKVTSIAWSQDGTRILTASNDGTARIWPTQPDYQRLEAHARNRVFRTLTEAERRHHMLPPPA